MKTRAVFYTSRGAGYRGRLISGRFSRGFFGLSLSAVFAVLATTSAFATDPDPELIAAKKTVASKAYVDTKQDKIPTDKVLVIDSDGIEDDVYVPAIVTTNTSGTELNGDSVGLLSLGNVPNGNGIVDFEGRDDLVPTIGLVADEFSLLYDELNAKQDILPAPWSNSTGTVALGSTGGQTIDLVTEGNVGHRYITGGGSAPLTLKDRADSVISYVKGRTSLEDFQRSNFGADTGTIFANTNNGYITGALVSLELLKDTYADLAGLINNATATLSWTSAETAAVNAYSTTFDASSTHTAGNWLYQTNDQIIDTTALASALALKQNIIPAGTYGANNSVITYDATSGTTQERWILGAGSTLPHDFIVALAGNALSGNNMNGLRSILLPGGVAPTLEEVKNSVVPAEILGDVLGSKQAVLGQKASDARAQAITRGTYGYPESAYITAGGSVGLTTQSGAPAIINYVNGTVATDEDFTTFTTGTFGANSATNQNYIKNALVSLELLKDVYGELNTKIANNALPTGTTGTVVTYNGTNAQTGVQEFTETAIYSGPTAQNPYNATNDAGKLATAGFVESTKQDKIPVQTMTIGTGNTAFTAPLSLVSYPTTTDGVVGQLAVFDESAFNNYVRANNIDTNNMGLSDGVNLVSNIMMEVMPNSVPTSYMVVGLLDLFGQGIGESYNIKIPASGQYDLSGNNPYTDGNGTTNTDWLNAGVKGTGVATRTGANGVIGERKIFEATDFANYHTTGLTQNQKDIQDISIPTMGAVMTAINAHTPATLSWTATETTATGGYSTAFDDTTGNWPAADANKLIDGTALANGLVLKQNKIPTGLVVFEDGDVQGGNDLTVRALVATNASGTEVLGNTIGIVDANTIANSNEAGLALYGDSENYGSEMDNFVPTVRAVANALTDIWSNMPWWTALSWSINVNGASDNGVNRTAAINAYNTTFGSGTNNWAGTSTHLIDGQFLANSLALKQNKIPATDDDYYSVLTDGDTDGEVGKLRVLTAEYMENNGESFASWVPNDNEIVTAGAIHRELLNNWQPIIPASMASNVIAHQTLSLPSFVVANVLTNGASPTLSSGTYGIITQDNIEDYAGLWSEFALLSNMDSAIPTVKAVANAITRLEWNSRIENTINAYRTQFFASGSDVWWFSEYDKLINTSVFSKGLALKQNKLVAKASNARAQAVTRSTAGDTSSAYITAGGSVGLTTRSGAPAIINYVNGTVATDEDFTTFTNSTFGTATGDALTTNKNYIKNALVSLELLKDVYSALHNEIQNATPTGTLGNVAMYDANTGALGNGQPVASAAIYTTDNNVTTLSNGNSIANIAAVETKQAKIPTTSNGTNNTPNYVYDATTNSTADGSVVTTTGTAGTVSQRGIATAAVPNGSGGYTNGDWIPTVGAMMAAITNQVTSATETLSWTATETTATQNYSTTFNGTTNNWPAADEDKLVDGAALANGLAQKQNKMTCAGYETGHENDINYCWLWRIAD